MNTLVTSKQQIVSSYPYIFEGIGRFPGPPYHIQVIPNVTPKQTSMQTNSCAFKRSFQERGGQNA